MERFWKELLTNVQYVLAMDEMVKWTFLCGKTREISKDEYNKFKAIGQLEACLHTCPEHKDPHDCNLLDPNQKKLKDF